MQRRDRDPGNESAPSAGRLVHNPFAALKPAAQAGAGTPAPGVVPARGAPSAERSAGAGRIVVRRERKGHGGKAVTIAEGAGLAGIDVARLARDAARGLGAGARVVDGALVVQGEQTERLIAWLAARGLGPIARGN